MTRSALSADHMLGKVQWAVDKMTTSGVCFACLAWLYGLFVGMLISLTNAYAGCGRPTLNLIERLGCLGLLHSGQPWVAPFQTAKLVLFCSQ